MMKLKLSIVMPVWNEGVNLPITLKVIKAMTDIPHEVLVVYDFPEDNSIPAVKAMQKRYPGLRLVYNQLGRGIPNAIQAGINAARGEYVLLLAADEIGPEFAIKEMVALMDKGCDLVSATRYARGGRIFGGSVASRVLSIAANRIFQIISGFALSDATVGNKMFRPELWQRLRPQALPAGWAVMFELGIKAQLAGLRLGEVPIVSINRFYGGKSSFRLGPWVTEYLKWFLWGLQQIYVSGRRRQHTAVMVPDRIGAEWKE